MQLRACALVLLALGLAGCGTGGKASADADTGQGEQLFKAKCGGCHTLKAAGTRGTQGPNLDDAFAASREEGLGESTIRDVVVGQIRYPVKPMPANLVKGDDADAVAAYVASVAANPEAQEQAGKTAATGDPKSLFASQCGSCHTLSAADTSGTIGPNLDQTQKDRAAIIKQITNGGGGMPPFKDVLDEKQIRALAEFILKSKQG